MGYKLYKFFICTGLLFGMLRICFASNFYFSSSDGDDANSREAAQSPSSPWKSIQKLNDISPTLKAGDSIFFKRGDVFQGTIRLTRGGRASAPIFFTAYGKGELPVITSLIKVAGWNDVGNGVFQTTIPGFESSKLKIILVDGQLEEVGRYPNVEAKNAGYLTIRSTANYSIVGEGVPFNADGGEVVIRKNNWIIDSHPIRKTAGDTIVFEPLSTSGYRPMEGYGFFLQNHVGTLDQFGEWAYSEKQGTLHAYFGNKNPLDVTVEVASSDYLLVTNVLVQHLTFKNLHFKGSNKNLLHFERSSNILVEDCLLELAGENGIYSYGTPDFTVKNNQIKNSLSGAIFFWHSTPRAIITDNVIENTMPFQGMGKNSDLNGSGIYLAGDADDSRVVRNRILSSGYNGIHFGGNRSFVKNNLIQDFCRWKQDGAGIYMNSDGLTNSNNRGRVIEGNIVLGGEGAKEGTAEQVDLAEGIYLDDNTEGVKVYQNTVAHINGKGIYLHNASYIQILENLVYDSQVQLKLSHDNLGKSIRNVEVSDNQLATVGVSQLAISISSIDPDIDQMGSFSTNYFLDPFQNEYIFETVGPDQDGVGTKMNLHDWVRSYGFDSDSFLNDVYLDRFRLLSRDVVKQSDFNHHIDLVAGTYHATSNRAEKGIDGSSLQITPGDSQAGLVYIQLGRVAVGDEFLVEMDVQSPGDWQSSELFLEKSFERHQSDAVQYFSAGKNVEKVKANLKAFQDTENESLVLRVSPGRNLLLIDNLKIARVKTEEIESPVLFNYNATDETAIFPLTGVYKDSKSVLFKDSVEIPPYQSILLVKVH